MAKITADQKKALEAAGYTVSGNTVKTKDGGSIGGYNENGKIWSGSSKVRDILKSSPKPEEKPAPKPAKRESKPAKAEEKPARPKANPARKPGGARPEPGKAGSMPAAKPKEESKASAGLPVLGAAAAAATAGRKPAAGKPYNPTYSGRGKAPEGFQGRFATEVARPRTGGGARAVGVNPARRALGRSGGVGVMKMPDILELRNMNKGGLVKKPAKTYKK